MSGLEFDEQTVVLTGASGGLGVAICRRLLAAGAKVIAPLRSKNENAFASHFENTCGGELVAITGVDLTEEDDVEGVFDAAHSAGNFAASIHLVGGYRGAPFVETSLSDLDFLFALNVRSAWLCTRAASRRFINAKSGGRILNVSAKPAIEPAGGTVTYAMTKAAVATMCKNAAKELSKDGVLINAIAPSVIDTKTNREAMPNAEHDLWPTPVEVAEVIVSLCSTRNSVTSGAVIPVYGKSV